MFTQRKPLWLAAEYDWCTQPRQSLTSLDIGCSLQSLVSKTTPVTGVTSSAQSL